MAVAQTFPDQRGPHVNDYADILSDEAEARIAAELDATLRDHGAQVTIVTLTELRFYTNDLAIADYARGLFDDWQLGQADGSTAILLLILRDDQEMHIRLGEAYDSDWNMTAARVVGEVIPSRFAEGDFRKPMPRFSADNYPRNLALIDGFRSFAKARGWTTAQAALAWVLDRGDHLIPIPGTRSAAHLAHWATAPEITLSQADRAEIARLLPPGFANGDRYSEAQARTPERYC